MADSTKQYAWYLEGNQLAIIEKDVNFDNNVDNKEFGPGTSRQLWKSPQSTVVDALEVKYVYAPTYKIQSTYTNDSDLLKFIGWGSDGTNLLLFTYRIATQKDLSSKFAADDWIYINSGKWIGLHQVKSTGTSTGILTLKTKCSLIPNKLDVIGTFDATSDVFSGEDAANTNLMQEFKDDSEELSTKYIFVVDAADTLNNGFFEITHNETHGVVNFINKITINATNDYTSATTSIQDESTDTITIYNAFYEQIEIYKNIEVLEDESFELDLPLYLQKALVYYVKAKMAEDSGVIELREFALREFKKMVEKYETSRISGPRMVFPGAHGIR